VSARRRAVALAAFATAWAGGIFWASAQPDPQRYLPSGLLLHDKLLHAAIYAVLGALVAATILATRVRAGRALALAALLGTAYGATDEWHQSYVPGRQADPVDLGADATGALAGAAAVLALRGRTARASIRA
jgi:VanZ family protein